MFIVRVAEPVEVGRGLTAGLDPFRVARRARLDAALLRGGLALGLGRLLALVLVELLGRGLVHVRRRDHVRGQAREEVPEVGVVLAELLGADGGHRGVVRGSKLRV